MDRHYFEAVYDVARMVPHGRVSTYGAVADFLGLGSSRMVGWALRHCSELDEVPAHRIVNRNGELTGRKSFRTPTEMEERLHAEGIEVKDNKVVDFKKRVWHPREMNEV